MATETDETSTGDERDESASADGDKNVDIDGEDASSQEELAEAARAEDAQRRKESKRKAGPIVFAASICIGAVGLATLYLSTTVIGSHPLVENGLAVLGVADLVLAMAIFVRKNWPRALVLAAMPLNIVVVLLCLTLVSSAKYLVFLLCIVAIVLMFRQPVLDEYDAPEE